MARLIFIILFLPLITRAAFVDVVRINPLGNTVQVSGTVQTTVTNPVTSVSATVLNFPNQFDVNVLNPSLGVSATVLNQITGFNLESTQLDVLSELQSIDNRLISPLSVTVSGTQFKALGTQLVSGDRGQIVQSVIHGLTTGGGGGYVDVKVNPSGSLVVDASGSSVDVSGTVSVNNFPTFTGLTNAELRASPVVVSGTVQAQISTLPNITVVSSALPTNAATQVTQAQVLSTLQSIDLEVGLSTTTLGEIRDKIPTAAQRTPLYTSSTTTGTIALGAKMVSFHNAGFLNATVLGTILSGGDVITFEAPDQDTLGAIAYVATGTTLRILEVR